MPRRGRALLVCPRCQKKGVYYGEQRGYLGRWLCRYCPFTARPGVDRDDMAQLATLGSNTDLAEREWHVPLVPKPNKPPPPELPPECPTCQKPLARVAVALRVVLEWRQGKYGPTEQKQAYILDTFCSECDCYLADFPMVALQVRRRLPSVIPRPGVTARDSA